MQIVTNEPLGIEICVEIVLDAEAGGACGRNVDVSRGQARKTFMRDSWIYAGAQHPKL